jgi:hypothetical protein
MTRHWQDLERRQRAVIVIGGVADTLLRGAALIDLARRRSDQVNGSKAGWMVAITAVSSFGVLPASYFLFGRRGRTRPRA